MEGGLGRSEDGGGVAVAAALSGAVCGGRGDAGAPTSSSSFSSASSFLKGVGKGDMADVILRAAGGLGLYSVRLCLCTPSSRGGSTELFLAVLRFSRS